GGSGESSCGFFFQAEDGIRDATVTGVQTCALPIYAPPTWDQAERALEQALKHRGATYRVDQGGGAFYGPKIDIKFNDAIGREWRSEERRVGKERRCGWGPRE